MRFDAIYIINMKLYLSESSAVVNHKLKADGTDKCVGGRTLCDKCAVKGFFEVPNIEQNQNRAHLLRFQHSIDHHC